MWLEHIILRDVISMNKQENGTKVDELDKRILRMLIRDGRVNYITIAKTLGRTPTTIKNRILKLIERDVLKKVVPVIDYRILGFSLSAIIFIDAKPGFLEETVEFLKRMPNVLLIYEITGEYNFLVRGIFKNEKELSDFIEELRKSGFITRIGICIIIRGWEKFYVDI